jgi:long-chain acyl-CoA synthetase
MHPHADAHAAGTAMIHRPSTEAAAPQPRLSVRRAFAGKHVLVTGTTGFVGKVLLALIAAELPDVRRVSVLVRTNREYPNARDRFDAVVALSEPFQAVAEKIGVEALEKWCDEKVNVVAGDITFDHLGLSPEDYADLTKNDPIDVILHCAGNVNFNPPLDQALSVNTMGVGHKLGLAKAAGCGIVHMSTCFVAGEVDGPVPESDDDTIVGYTPSGKEGFDPERELEDCLTLTGEIRKRAQAQAMESRFRDEAKDELTRKGLDHEDPSRLQEAIKSCRNRWIDQELVDEGTARAKHWGWTNTYTYSKSMGEQITVARARAAGVPVTIVRPAIVESSQDFPFAGWNEGVNTSAPIVYIMWRGHRFLPSDPEVILDIIPVDDVCRGTLQAAAALLEGRARRVYQFCTGDVNPMNMFRVIELTNLAWRRDYDTEVDGTLQRAALKQLESLPVEYDAFKRMGAPAVNRLAKAARALIKQIPPAVRMPVKPMLNQVEKGLGALEQASKLSGTIMEMFVPFIHDNKPVFSSRSIRALDETLVEDERTAFGYRGHTVDWRHYWMDVHLPGLRKWVFGELDEKVGRVKKIARARDLLEVFRTATRTFAERRAFSHFTHEGGLEVTYTYQDVWDAARRVAHWLQQNGVGRGDKVVLMSKNEPAWPMAYFGILCADAVAVPLDPEMPEGDARRIVSKSEAKLVIVHESRDHHHDFGVRRVNIGEVFEADALDDIPMRHRENEVASLLFTSGTTGDPKGVMLTHGNFTALLASLQGTFNISERDKFLSVLPLFHTFEFSCGLLLPLSLGSHVTYLEEIDGPLLRAALKAFKPTALIGVPALWDLLHRRIETQVGERGDSARTAFKAMLRLSRFLRTKYGVNAGPLMFSEVHRTMGGRIRYLISGGAALGEPALKAFEGLGFDLLEGYGLTEAAPVLTVRRPGDRRGGGSVGKPLTGVEVQIINPDKDGVGEVIARGDNVMLGYLKDPHATEQTVRKGWLHTGDLGRLDKDGRLTLVGRRKELIVTSSGKNVYPDELEPLYAAHELIEELCLVGIPDPQGDERVAALVVLKDDAPEDAHAEIRTHFQLVGSKLGDHQKVRTMRFWHGQLPRTATRKVKRAEVRAELLRLLDMSRATRTEGNAVPEGREPAWLYACIAGLTGSEAVDIEPTTHLIQDLGLSSLQLVELRLLIEERGSVRVSGDDLVKCGTVMDVVQLVGRKKGPGDAHAENLDDLDDDGEIEVPPPVSTVGRKLLGRAQRAVYNRGFRVTVTGEENIPLNQQTLVIANHCSHLDMGLVKFALGDYGDKLSALAASDYFFDTPQKRAYFEEFTNLIPVDRSGSLESSLRLAEQAIRQGRIVLVFPEGTRSVNGELQDFKHGVGYLQAKSGLGILPVYLKGTHRSLPKGSMFPGNRKLGAKIGSVITPQEIASATAGLNRIETYQKVADMLEQAIVALRDGLPYPWRAAATPKKADGITAVFDELQGKFVPGAVHKPVTWYFSLGDGADGKWTVAADPHGVRIEPGRPPGGQADCVLKTDPKTFERIVRERYVPSFAEFADGRVKTNAPDLLRTFQTVFGL